MEAVRNEEAPALEPSPVTELPLHARKRSRRPFLILGCVAAAVLGCLGSGSSVNSAVMWQALIRLSAT